MDPLWAPWRKGYILQKPTKKCFICRVKSSSRDKANFVLKRTPHSLVILNIYPYNNGHLMVIPLRHVDSLDQLEDHELLDLMHLTNESIKRIRRVMKPHGLNVGINFGRVAGAGVLGHVHLHVVPRYSGDTNFMPVVGNAKIISESLKSVYERLRWRGAKP